MTGVSTDRWASHPQVTAVLMPFTVLALATAAVPVHAAAVALAPDSGAVTLSRIRGLLASGHTVGIEHLINHTYRLPFYTRLLSVRVETTVLARGSVPQGWVTRFIAALDSTASMTVEQRCLPPAFAATDSERILISVRERSAVLGEISVAGGRVAFSDSTGQAAFADLGDRFASIKAALQAALPRDDLLDRVLSPPAMPAPVPCVSRVDSQPVARLKIPPDYPDAALGMGVSGTVWVMALVDRFGQVTQTRVRVSIPELDEAAVRAVEQWQFRPAQTAGQSVAVWVQIPVKFTLH